MEHQLALSTLLHLISQVLLIILYVWHFFTCHSIHICLLSENYQLLSSLDLKIQNHLPKLPEIWPNWFLSAWTNSYQTYKWTRALLFLCPLLRNELFCHSLYKYLLQASSVPRGLTDPCTSGERDSLWAAVLEKKLIIVCLCT